MLAKKAANKRKPGNPVEANISMNWLLEEIPPGVYPITELLIKASDIPHEGMYSYT
jgi:hypothetical protein